MLLGGLLVLHAAITRRVSLLPVCAETQLPLPPIHWLLPRYYQCWLSPGPVSGGQGQIFTSEPIERSVG